MKIRNVIMAGVIAAGLAISGSVQASHEKEESEQKLTKSDVPAAVQKTAEAEAKGGKIVRWEKEGDNYEAVIEKNGKQTGVELTADGKIVSRHDESKEHKEKGEKY
jgi:plastocyanin